MIPSWAWAGINRCRLFLQATTLADITSMDGKYIPGKIRQVEGIIRTNTLDFPFQTKPPNSDIVQWQYFIDSISDGGNCIPLWGIGSGHQIKSSIMYKQ